MLLHPSVVPTIPAPLSLLYLDWLAVRWAFRRLARLHVRRSWPGKGHGVPGGHGSRPRETIPRGAGARWRRRRFSDLSSAGVGCGSGAAERIPRRGRLPAQPCARACGLRGSTHSGDHQTLRTAAFAQSASSSPGDGVVLLNETSEVRQPIGRPGAKRRTLGLIPACAPRVHVVRSLRPGDRYGQVIASFRDSLIRGSWCGTTAPRTV